MSHTAAADLTTDLRPLPLEYGGVLPGVEMAYETWGTLSPARDNVILICPAFSAHSHAQSSDRDPTPGWWEGMVGPGRAFDTNRFCVLCPSLLGGSYGTTGPPTVDPRTGAPRGRAFPVVTTRDIVDVHVRLLDQLGIEQVYAAAGGSLGAMQTLELGLRHPSRVARVVAIAGTDFTRPYTAAIRHLGRRAIMLDPGFAAGETGGDGPVDGLRLARELGTLFYRSREEFNERFAHTPIAPPSRERVTFDVQSYLEHQGHKAVGRFDVNSYLTMSLAMDLHDVWRGHASPEAAASAAQATFWIVAVREDRLIGIDEQESLHEILTAAGADSRFQPISSKIGHDAFLVELDRMTEIIRPMLA